MYVVAEYDGESLTGHGWVMQCGIDLVKAQKQRYETKTRTRTGRSVDVIRDRRRQVGAGALLGTLKSELGTKPKLVF